MNTLVVFLFSKAFTKKQLITLFLFVRQKYLIAFSIDFCQQIFFINQGEMAGLGKGMRAPGRARVGYGQVRLG